MGRSPHQREIALGRTKRKVIDVDRMQILDIHMSSQTSYKAKKVVESAMANRAFPMKHFKHVGLTLVIANQLLRKAREIEKSFSQTDEAHRSKARYQAK